MDWHSRSNERKRSSIRRPYASALDAVVDELPGNELVLEQKVAAGFTIGLFIAVGSRLGGMDQSVGHTAHGGCNDDDVGILFTSMRHDLRNLGKSLGVANRSAAKFENEHVLLQE